MLPDPVRDREKQALLEEIQYLKEHNIALRGRNALLEGDRSAAVFRVMNWLTLWSPRLGPDASVNHTVNAPFSLSRVILGERAEDVDKELIATGRMVDE